MKTVTMRLIGIMIAIVSVAGCSGVARHSEPSPVIHRGKLTASGGEAGERFGHSVGIDNGIAIVGAVGTDVHGSSSGSAYIFLQSGSNTWDQATQITPTDGAPEDRFGWSVAISGSYAIVGAPPSDNERGSGSAYAYALTERESGVRVNTQRLLPVSGDSGGHFGTSVSISGDYVIVGAPNGLGSGSAYIFRRIDHNSWDRGAKITAPDGAEGAGFGASVAISGNYAIVGAPEGGPSGAGSAYIFRRTGANSWDRGTQIIASDGAEGAGFGTAVAISGDYAIVGASNDGGNGEDSGSAYIFRRTEHNSWDSEAKIIAHDGAAGDRFGMSVTISDSVAGVGASRSGDNGEDSGSTYVFRRTGYNSWDSGNKAAPREGAAADPFGYSVAISDDTVLAGAPESDGDREDSGSVHVLVVRSTGSTAGESTESESTNVDDATARDDAPVQTTITAADRGRDDGFGISVGVADDTVIVGASGDNDRGSRAGSAYIFRQAGAHAWDQGIKITPDDIREDDMFGRSVAVFGDYAIVGAPTNLHRGGPGRAYILHRTEEHSWDNYVKITASDRRSWHMFGWSVDISDDYAIVGDRGHDEVGEDSGSAYIFNRTGLNAWDSQFKLVAPNGAAGDEFGRSVGISGDYAIVGMPNDDDNGEDSGSAYIFLRTGPNAWDTGTRITAPDGAAGDQFGWSVAIAGDYAIVGTSGDNNAPNAESAYIFRRTGANSWDDWTKIYPRDGEVGERFGRSVAISGDYAIIGAPGSNDRYDRVSVYYFRRTGPNSWDGGTGNTDPLANGSFVTSVAISGDTVIVGVVERDGGHAYALTPRAVQHQESESDSAWSAAYEEIIESGHSRDHRIDSLLLRLADEGDTQLFARIVEEFAVDLSAAVDLCAFRGPYGYLERAVRSGSIDIVDYLLDNGVGINSGDELFYAPILFAAVDNGSVELAQHLVERGADPFVTRNGREGPVDLLHGAEDTYGRQSAMAEYLRSIGAGTNDLEYRGYGGWASSTVERLRIRATPDTSSEVLGHLTPDSEAVLHLRRAGRVEIDGLYHYWHRITTSDGVEGWVFGGYLNFAVWGYGGPCQ